MTIERVLVVGASGLVGVATARAFAEAGYDVVTMSRRPPDLGPDVHLEFVPVDLLDAQGTADAVERAGAVDAVVYTAVYEQADLVDGWSARTQMDTNLRMLDNVLGPLSRTGSLEHVTLLQGTKAYGVHLHPIPVPARERQARDPHENFYWLQEDYVRELAARTGVGWTILRPVHVVGPAYGVAYSTPPVIGAFAAVCAEEGLPFGFPGGPHQTVKQVVDARLVGRAAVWTAATPGSWGEHYNLTNGEVFTWRDIWPRLAEMLGMDCAEIAPTSMAEFLPAHAGAWDRVRERHGLARLPLAELLGRSHMYADYTFGYGVPGTPPPAVVSTVKVRQAGFHEVMDTEASFADAFAELVARGVLPEMP